MEKINIVNAIYDQIVFENESHKERSMRHYPSSLCAETPDGFVGTCRRQSWYSMKGYEKSDEIGAVALLKMDMGNKIHDYLDGILDRAMLRMFPGQVTVEGVNLGPEQAFIWKSKMLSLPVSGRLDKVVKFDGLVTGVVAGEWKSTYGTGVGFIQRDGAKTEHILQCLAYLEQDVIPIEAIWLLYVARDSGFLYGFQIEKDGDKLVVSHLNSNVSKVLNINWGMVDRALFKLEIALELDAIPDRDYSATVNEKTGAFTKTSPWQCRYCAYRGHCYGVKE